MFKKGFTFLYFSLFVFLSHSQPKQWVWMKGDNSYNQAPVYGTMGVANAANKPGALYECAEWKDQQGNFWLFGGADPSGARNDLWKYDPITNNWTWVAGSGTTNQPGIYGTQGITSASNYPGSRGWGTASWVDNNGVFWLFGGEGRDINNSFGELNDLWKYDPVSNLWTWMKGSNLFNQPGNYGTKGVTAASNLPGARYETSCTWVDNNNNLWLFGGVGYDKNSLRGDLGDLWMYDISTNNWTWMSGDDICNQPGNYGTKGLASATNKPGARGVFSSWKDLNGDLWFFGGSSNSGMNAFNDMWKYSISSGWWTWVHGPNTYGQPGSYGTICQSSPSNIPTSRSENRTRWVDNCGYFWMFGGFITHNDLWRYSPLSNEWTWVSGDNVPNQLGSYGAQGVAAPSNKPESRGGAIGWSNADGLWLFGGFEHFLTNRLNDLWKYIPDKPTAAFTTNTVSGCAPLTASFSNTSISNCNEIKSYAWTFDDPTSGTNNTSTNASPAHTFNTAGTYTVTLIVTSCTGSVDSTTLAITVLPQPTISISGSQSFCIGESTILTANGGVSYTWGPSTGLSSTTSNSVVANPTVTTTYTITAMGSNSCSNNSIVNVTVHPLPTIVVNSINPLCLGDSATLLATGANTYQWSPTTNLINITNNSALSTTTTNFSYTVTGTDINNCTDSSIYTITVVPKPLADAGPGQTICEGTSATLTATGGISYLWDTGLATHTLVVTPIISTSYSVIVSNANCSDVDSVLVTVLSTPIVSAGTNTTIFYGLSAPLSASTASGGATYNWIPTDGLSCTNCSVTIATPSVTTTYTVLAVDSTGCSSFDIVTITVTDLCSDIFIPNVFSPNGDSQNDEFKIYGNCIKSLTCIVYSRWGEAVAELNENTLTWDGMFRGAPMDSGIFTYSAIVESTNGEVVYKKGSVTLIK